MTELLLGVSLGWAAGISPGPLLTLVITGSLRRGPAVGVKMAFVPLITDAPAVTAGVVLAAGLPDRFVAVLSGLGGAYLVWLGISEMRTARGAEPEPASGAERDVRRAVVANILSPHPWLFWVAVGGPIVVEAWDRAPASGLTFVIAFYTLLVGTKVVLALVVGHGRRFVDEAWYPRLVVAGGAVIALMGVVLLVGAVV
jgi:threonine/homoserine/homoserine lactone efflux protein